MRQEHHRAGRAGRGWRDVALLAGVLLLCLASVPSFDAAGGAPRRIGEAAAGLREARLARAQGRLDRAAALLEQVAGEHPIIADHASALRAEILLESGEDAEAIAVLLEAIAAFPDSSLHGDMLRSLGEMRRAFGDEDGARAAWNAALREGDRHHAPAMLLSLAESYERDGSAKEAFERYRELWLTFPDSDEAERASERLGELEAQDPKRVRDADSWRRYADRLFRAHRNARALAAYDRALELGLTKSGVRRAAYQRAHTLFRMRRYPEAVEAFGALSRGPDQRLWHARSLARAGRVPESIEAFEKLARDEKGQVGLRALLLAGLLLDGRDRHDEARRHFERVASSRRYPGLAHGALWRLAWGEYLAGDCQAALPRLERLVEIERDPIDALRSRYWRARCLEKLGRPDAGSEFARIATDYPFTYYGWRASFRAQREAGDAQTPERSLRRGAQRLPTRSLARARILISAGHPELARRELRLLTADARSLSERLELAQLLSDSGDFHAAQRVVVDGHLLELARGPVAGHEALWWHAWPAAFGAEVSRATAEPGAAERELVYAIMREESGYRPAVLSVSGAYGLMQIMPSTGERLARDLGRPDFDAEDLLEPDVNVRLGAWYLGQLGARFPRRLSAAIASYNAGPEAVSSWLVQDAARLDDEWVEAIPYDQTRSYVKRVLRSLHAYRVLY